MTDPEPQLQNEYQHTFEDDPMMARIGYILYLASLLTGITAVAGLVLALIYRKKSSPWLAAHYRFQIRTFWIGLLYMTIATLLTVIGVGLLLLPLVSVWIIVRSVRGWRELERRREPTPLLNWAW